MNVFIAVPEVAEETLRTLAAAGFSHDGEHYDFSVALGEGRIALRNGERWRIFCHRAGAALPPAPLQIVSEVEGETMVENREWLVIVEAITALGGIIMRGGELADFLLNNLFILTDETI